MSSDGAMTSDNAFFAENEETRRCIAILTSDTSSTAQRNDALTKMRAILDKYLECPSLLDGYLEEMVSTLTNYAQAHLNDTSDGLSHVLSALYALSKVRGRKRIQRFFPHEAKHVEPVFLKLQQLDKTLGPSTFTTGPQSWESVYVLWIWMEMLSLVPFDCSVLSNDTLVPTLVVLAKSHLSLAGPIREAASSCLASWLNRPEKGSDEVDSFITWSHDDVLVEFQKSGNNIILVIGVLETLAKLLKCCTNNVIHLKMEPLWETALAVAESSNSTSSMILQRLLVKWFSRMACAYLPPRVASWRYQRGRRSLFDNVVQQVKQQTTIIEEKEKSHDDDGNDKLFYVPDQVEDAMGIVLQSLTDPSTVVRWSAAKGVGRITERLPAICAHDVLDYILELCRDPEKDTAWHGACLALAELARRGLLLPSRLPDVVPLIVKAIQFDVRRGQSSVGSHVRDAACYTYWAFARAYAPSILKPFVPELSRSIVLAFLFDREVNCRRAASAAFQECVGRQGANNFKHGISILTTADYFSLGNVKNAFTSVAFHVAHFPEYQCPIIDHLYKVKLSHWDTNIRTLASKSLHGVTPLNPVHMRDLAVPHLVEQSMNDDLHVRHGAVLGLAEVVLALGEMEGTSFDEFNWETLESIVELVAKIEKARLYRGRGGEIMRSAVCRLIECISQANVPLTVKQQVRYLDSIDACLKHPNEDIQQAASNALWFLMRNYFPVRENGPSDRLQKRVIDKYVDIVNTSVNPAETRGFALALGSLPSKLVAPSPSVLSSVLDCLCNAARYDSRVGNEPDAETRRNAVLSITRVCETVGVGSDSSNDDIFPTVTLSPDMVAKVYESLLLALEDYNVDRRGDVGSWSRVAAMDGLESLTYATATCVALETANGGVANTDTWFDGAMCVRVVGGLLKQFSEKLDSVRSRAGDCLSRMLASTSLSVPFVPRKDDLLEILQLRPQSDGSLKITNWANPAVTYRMAMDAADINEFFSYVMSGMIISVGGLGESVSRYSEEALLAWMRGNPIAGAVDRPTRVANELVRLFQCNQQKRRVILPLLKTLDKLLNRGCLNAFIHVKESEFCVSLLSCMVTEAKGCNDVHTLLAVVGVSLGLLSSHHDQTLNDQLLTFICRMLGHRFPRMRRFTADHLYVRLLEESDILNKQDKLDSALQLLLEAPWDSEMTTIETSQLSVGLAELIGITLAAARDVESAEATPRKSRVVDEFASYASLVNSRS